MNKQFGFTLFELIVTLAVISILSIISVPTFIDSSGRQNFNRSVSELKGSLERAQAKAALQGNVITVNVGTRSTSNNASTYHWLPSGSSALLQSNSSVYFGPKGHVQASATNEAYGGVKTFTVCDGPTASARFSRTIQINRLGVIVDSGTKEGCSV